MNATFDPTFRLEKPLDDSAILRVRSKIEGWIESPDFKDLTALYGGEPRIGSDLDHTLQRLETFSDRWDFRRIARERGALADDGSANAGAARWLSASTGLREHENERIMRDAANLGLVHSQPPPLEHYDVIAVLGGARLSCKLRTVLAAELVASLRAPRYVALLGAARPIPDSERDATDTYAPGAGDEFDLMCAAGVQVFGATWTSEQRSSEAEIVNSRWAIKEGGVVSQGKRLHLLAVSAPSSDPLHRRANSADTINFLFSHPGLMAPCSLLLITSQIYVPYVQLEAIRNIALPRKVVVHTVGVGADRLSPLQGLASANHYLQEIRSAIQAANRFCRKYALR